MTELIGMHEVVPGLSIPVLVPPCDSHDEEPAVKVVQVRLRPRPAHHGRRLTTVPAKVCQGCLDRIESIFPPDELVVSELDA